MKDKNLYVDNEISGFRKRYLIYLGVLFVLVFGILAFLWVKMSNYQEKAEELTEEVSVQDEDLSLEDSERAAQKVFTDMADSLSLEGWTELYYQSHPDRFDRQEDVEALISERIINAATGRYKAADSTIDSPKYLIVSDGTALAEFTLSGSGEDYTVAGTHVFLGGNESAEITAPSDCMIQLNGSEITEEYAEIEKNAVSVNGYDEQLTNPVIMNTYRISGLMSAEGDVSAPEAYLSDDGNFYQICDDNGGYVEKAQSFIKSLLHYYASGKENTDANAGEVLSHVASSSGASSIINAAKSGLEWVTPNYSISYNIESSVVCKVADNCCFVDVAYTPEGGENSTEESAETSDGDEADEQPEESDKTPVKGAGVYRVYFLDDGNGYKIVLFEGIR